MKDRSKHLTALAVVGVCFAALGPYVAHAQDAAVETVDPAVAAASLSGDAIVTPPPLSPVEVYVGDPGISEPAFESPEEENLTEGVNVADPGHVMPVDPGVADAAITSSIGGELPDGVGTTGKGAQMADQTATGSDCSASAAAPSKDQMKIEASGSISCGSVQRTLNVVVCIDYRPAGTWEELACKPKTASQMKSISKKVSVACVPGRFYYRTRVTGVSTSKSGAQADVPEDTAPTGGRIFCAS